MGALKMGVGVLIFILVVVVIAQPLTSILDATQGLRDKASTTMMYGTDADGNVVAVGYANAGGDLTEILLFGIGLFMTIGFIIWLVMRAPNEPDYPDPYAYQQQGGRFR